MTEARDLRCFVIGPIGDSDAAFGTPQRRVYEDSIELFEKVVVLACEQHGIVAIRADRLPQPGDIADQVFRHLRDSYLVIADVTGANPNVMYELGLRHSTGKPTIQIGEKQRLPFDISTIRTITFRRSEAGLIDAQRQLSASIDAIIQGGGGYPALATRIWFEPVGPSAALPIQAPDDEPGYLEKLVAMRQAIDASSLNLHSIAKVIQEIAALTERSSIRETATAAERLKIVDALAAKLAEPASRLEIALGEYRQSIERMDPGVRYALTHSSDGSSTESFREKVQEVMLAVDENMPAIEGYRRALLEKGEAARSLRRAFGRIAISLEQLLVIRRIFDDWKALL